MKDRIKTIRTHEGKTQQEFADKLGLSRNFVSLLESGDRQPSDRTLDDICRLYNVNRQWLDTGEGEMYVPLSDVETIAKMLNDVAMDEPTEAWQQARQTIIAALAEMPPKFWAEASDFLHALREKMPKSNGE